MATASTSQLLPSPSLDDLEIDRILNQEASLVSREQEVMRIIACFKMNPYEILELDFMPSSTVTDSEIHKIYRKKSLLIHPDKLKHDRGVEAFDLLKKAETELLDVPKRKTLDETIYDARMLLLREMGLLPIIADDHERLRALKDPPLRERVKKKVKEMLIDEELRRRRANKMTMIAEGAEAKRVEEAVEKRKRKMEDDKKWEDTREDRVTDWRSFQKGPKRKKKTNVLGQRAAMSPQIYKEIPAHLAEQRSTKGTRMLEIERAKASFSVEALKTYLHGQKYLDQLNKVLPVLESEPAFDKSGFHYMGRDQKYRFGLAKEKRLFNVQEEQGWNTDEINMAESLLDMPAAFGLHRSMFINTLQSQTTPEQKELFLEPALKFEIIGCYAQTELGHGSNVRGLETTGTYNPETKSFIMNSPGLTAAKWWIGGLGRAADHAIVMAQLITPDGRNGALINRGPHAFVVPLRDVKTRETLPGRTIMDIGPKAGYLMTDNGTMLLDHVEIPHVNFLAGYAKVDANTGAYAKPPNAKLSYGTMTYIRASIVQQARMVLARSATVAIRYCSVRRQFADRDAPVTDEGNEPAETQVINYLMVQARIFPPLVQAFACHYTGKEMFRLYGLNQQAMADGDFSLLADVHASSSGLKSLCTIMASGAIEECRRACGGHGYSLAGGLASFYADYLPQVTWEGDSYMLTQQLGRYLFKTFRTLLANPEAPMSKENKTREYILKYISNPDAKAKAQYAGDFKDPDFYVRAFGHRAAYLTATALRKRDVERRTWNSLLIDIYRCSVAHSQFVLVLNFANAIRYDDELIAQPALHSMMRTCFELFAAYTMDAEAAEFLASGYLSPKQSELLRNTVHALFAELRPQAVSLVDAFGIPDYQLNSALGRYDGDVYPALMKFAQSEPLNATRFNVDVRSEEIEVGPENAVSTPSLSRTHL